MRNLSSEFIREPALKDNQKPRIGGVSQLTVAAVKQFYCKDYISRITPGRRDVITVRDNEGKKKIQKRHLTMSIKECFATFKEENPEDKIGISKFAELRPQNVLLSSQTPANVCLCIHHQNFILALDVLHRQIQEIPAYSKEFPGSCLISNQEPACWYSECKHKECGFGAKYGKFIGEGLLTDVRTRWVQWKEACGRITQCELKGSVKDVFEYVSSMAPKFIAHCFVKRKQEKRFEDDKNEALKPHSNCAVLQMYFAENYTCKAQDEVQSSQWNQSHVTLFN